jgi:hypothetical protein
MHFGTNQGGHRGEMAVPMAFQSALAGVLLAVEILADAAPLRTLPMLPLTKINLLKPLGQCLTEPAQKHASGRCLCQDPIYLDAYQRKYEALTSVEESKWRSRALSEVRMHFSVVDLRLVEHGDELVVKDILTGNLTIRSVANKLP